MARRYEFLKTAGIEEMGVLRAFGTECRVSLGEQRLAFDGLNHLALLLHVGIGSNHLEIKDPGAGARSRGRFEQAAATLGLSVCLRMFQRLESGAHFRGPRRRLRTPTPRAPKSPLRGGFMATTMCEIDGRRPAVATVRIRHGRA